ncbi:MAG TPA: Xaa-Pro peptidase family protein [Actinomycetes bacterium]|nr:Xaa-Pro peptidase family protein [Actinomycetes bacterium]
METDRLRRAQAATSAAELDALLITPGADLRYLTGYVALPLERLTCLVIPRTGEVTLVAPQLEVAAAQASPVGAMDIPVRGWDETDDPYALVASMLPSGGTVGLTDTMVAAHVLGLRRTMPTVQQTLAGRVMRGLRMRKSDDEVKALREAGEAIDRVHARVPDWLHAGRTEREIGDDIAEAIIDEGHVRADFVIVGSGPNGASPHHELSDRVLERGDPVVVDIGGTMPSGYCSDSTRTYSVGPAPADFLEYYGALQRAQEAAVAQVRPGVTAEAVDAAARGVLTDAGFGDLFIHRTGHGIGLETHEEPYIVAGNAETLQQGMVFSVEPGVYLPGRHGARIEDIVAVTADGVESLNRQPRELLVVDSSYSA